MSDGAHEATAGPDEQLAAIQAFDQALRTAAIDYWLFGGWAVDFWVGEVTRAHDDIDVAAWRSDVDAIRTALVTAGWEHTPTPEDRVGTRYRLGRVQVELTFVEAGKAGEVVVPLPSGAVTWSPEPFGDDQAQLGAVTCRIIPLPVLARGKATARTGSAEAAKDRADFAALSRVIDSAE